VRWATARWRSVARDAPAASSIPHGISPLHSGSCAPVSINGGVTYAANAQRRVILDHGQLPDDTFWITEPVDAPFHLCEAHGTGPITDVDLSAVDTSLED
jgi:hypothetical protein